MRTSTPSGPSVPVVDHHGKVEPSILDWEETSLTQLPHGWSRFRRETSAFLKSIGLGIVVAAYEGTFQKDFAEPKKVAVRRSRTTSLLKSLIHVLPIGFALYEIIINLHGLYLGKSFNKQPYYQLVAKAHEILINASLAAIVWSYVRKELMHGNGLPFGAFLGGLQFLSVSYLWSRELWSSISSTSYNLRKRLYFLLFIIICGTIAATAGPASATLLIPRELLWKLPPSYTAINGSSLDLWPDRLDPLQIPNECLHLDQSPPNPLCLGASWQAIHDSLQSQISFIGDDFNKPGTAFSGVGYILPIKGQAYINGGYASCPVKGLTKVGSQLCGVAEHSIIAAAAFSANSLYQSKTQTFVDTYHSIDKSVYAAYSAIECLSDTINGPGDARALQFPSLSRTPEAYSSPNIGIPVKEPNRIDLYSIQNGNTSEFRLVWTQLPNSVFGAGALGAIVLDPRSATPESLQSFTACTFAAGWGTSLIMTDNTNIDEILTGPTHLPSSFDNLRVEDPLGSGATYLQPLFANISGYSFPQRPIEIPLAWLAFLDPVIELPNGANTTAINFYMLLLPGGPRDFGVAKILDIMLNTGLSSVGQNLTWHNLPNGPIPGADRLVFETNHFYQGWAYTSSGKSTKLALAVMISYCALALTHMIYLGSTGISSDAWDSAAEVVALAMNSAPTEHLKNTCSGIIGVKPFRTRVRILATANQPGEHEDHLELVFGEKSEATTPEVRMVLGEEYGSLPPSACCRCSCKGRDRRMQPSSRQAREPMGKLS